MEVLYSWEGRFYVYWIYSIASTATDRKDTQTINDENLADFSTTS
jgi:hypothetical protein